METVASASTRLPQQVFSMVANLNEIQCTNWTWTMIQAGHWDGEPQNAPRIFPHILLQIWTQGWTTKARYRLSTSMGKWITSFVRRSCQPLQAVLTHSTELIWLVKNLGHCMLPAVVIRFKTARRQLHCWLEMFTWQQCWLQEPQSNSGPSDVAPIQDHDPLPPVSAASIEEDLLVFDPKKHWCLQNKFLEFQEKSALILWFFHFL